MSGENREYYLDYFKHMEDEDKKCKLGGMAWDDIGWHIHGATVESKLFTKLELGQLFPHLLGHLIVDDERYEKEKREYISSKENYLKRAHQLETNTQTWNLIDKSEKFRLNLANRYFEYARNCDELLKQLEIERNEWLKWKKNSDEVSDSHEERRINY